MSHRSLLSIVRSAGLVFLACIPCNLTVAAEGQPPKPNPNRPPASDEIKPLTDLDNTPGGGMLPGGTLPGGTLPGGSLPGGTLPGGTLPGGTLPGGTLPGGTLPGKTPPGGTLPGGTPPGGTLPGGPL
jgi:hypothetical protein